MLHRLVLGLYSRQWFGLGIEDWEQGAHTADLIKAVQDLFALFGDRHSEHPLQEQAKILLTRFCEAALEAVRGCTPVRPYCEAR